MYYRGAAAAVLMFDLTNYSSFEQLSYWANGKLYFPLNSTLALDSQSFVFATEILTCCQIGISSIELANNINRTELGMRSETKNDVIRNCYYFC
jgi:hypothetical protein